MKKVLLMSMQTAQLELSPARYQLLEELHARGFETYILLSGKLRGKNSYKTIDYVVDAHGMSMRNIRKKILEINPQIVIATTFDDTNSIYILPYIMKNTSFYYYNLEVYAPYLHKDVRKDNFKFYVKYKIMYPVNKIKEILYTYKVKAFTIQDNIRRKLSAKYHIQNPNTILIPNSYIFDETKIIADDQSGVIYTGGIERDFLLGQMDYLKEVKNTPLTFSGYIDNWGREKSRAIRKTNPNIRFKEQILSIDNYTRYLQQFAVGLVWYSPLREDESHYYMGLSSGKMFKHLSLGQPVIAVNCCGITEVIKKYKIGIVINSISELDSAYSEIMKNYSFYRENVIRTYKNKFDFKKIIIPFIDCLRN